jgi:dihydrofolate reductase
MRSIIAFNMITLDGFFEGPGAEIDWHHVDAEFNAFADEQLNEAGGLIFGRKTYQLMESYWPTREAIANDPVIANHMNAIPKIVVSETLHEVHWSHTSLIKGKMEDEIARLKQQPGKDLFVFGSADLSASMMEKGLIDEYRVMINPVLLGAGNPLFRNITARVPLKLTRAKVFQSGNVLLCYIHK